jgi:hypothetical protein
MDPNQHIERHQRCEVTLSTSMSDLEAAALSSAVVIVTVPAGN